MTSLPVGRYNIYVKKKIDATYRCTHGSGVSLGCVLYVVYVDFADTIFCVDLWADANKITDTVLSHTHCSTSTSTSRA